VSGAISREASLALGPIPEIGFVLQFVAMFEALGAVAAAKSFERTRDVDRRWLITHPLGDVWPVLRGCPPRDPESARRTMRLMRDHVLLCFLATVVVTVRLSLIGPVTNPWLELLLPVCVAVICTRLLAPVYSGWREPDEVRGRQRRR
jgi:hypothetical protein